MTDEELAAERHDEWWADAPEPTPGLVHDLPENDYHLDTESLSASGAKVLLGKRPPSPDSDAILFGHLLHTLILEPHKLDTYAVLNESVVGVKADGSEAANPKATKAWKDAVFAAKRAGLTVVTGGLLAKAEAMAAAVHAHPEAARLIGQATATEVSAYADHPSGARVRARFDAICPESVIDLKTAVDCDPDNFGRVMHKYLYHVSAANYLDVARANGLDADRFDLICVEKEPTPGGAYRVSVLEIHPDAIDRGRELMAEACARWLALGKRVDLPSYGDERHVIDLPPYAYDYDDLDDITISGVA